jgi:hypothetical protein
MLMENYKRDTDRQIAELRVKFAAQEELLAAHDKDIEYLKGRLDMHFKACRARDDYDDAKEAAVAAEAQLEDCIRALAVLQSPVRRMMMSLGGCDCRKHGSYTES